MAGFTILLLEGERCWTSDCTLYLMPFGSLGNQQKISAFADLTADHIDQSVTVSMQFEGGKSAVIFASFLSATGVGTDIYCEKGMLRLRRSNAINQWLEIHLTGETSRILTWDESECGLKLEAIETMDCLGNNQLESKIMSHQNSLDLMKSLDLIRQNF